jgi:7-cyano-7-deazaguanine synthase in queuosine biosynthesis
MLGNYKKPISTLLHLSGGQDSAYVAYKWLKENPDERILLHHINLRHSKEDRLIHEKKAVKDIINYFKSVGLRNFLYKESSFDYGTLPLITIKDIQIVSLFTGIILKTSNFKSIDKLLLAWHEGEVNREDIKKGYRVRNMLTALDVEKPIEFIFPIEFMNRKQMFDDMPIELTRLVSSCRIPNNGRHCGTCKTCVELKKAGIIKYFK